MRRSIIIILFLLVCTLSACASPAVNNSSPEATLKSYFEQFNNKNQAGMNALTDNKMHDADCDLSHLNSAKLISCSQDQTADLSSYKERFGNPYQVAVMMVKFEVNYKAGGNSGGLNNGVHNFRYYLAKQNEKSGWTIM